MVQQQAMSNNSGLRVRVVSALIMVPAAVAIIWIGREAFLAFLILLAAFMAWEWSRIASAVSRTAWVTMACILGATLLSLGLNLPLLAIMIVLMLGAMLVFLIERNSGMHGRILMFGGTLYIGAALLSAGWLRMQNDGIMLFLWLVAMVIATDVGAYVSGRSIGGAKLAPSISPNKTWAGLIGGMIAAATVSAVFAHFTGNDLQAAILLGLVLAAVAQTGDLLESWMKRQSGFKDSSNLIPGHGGILDRMDGFLAATPTFAFYIYYTSIV